MNDQTRALTNAFYITLLAVLLGSTLALGAFVAPVIFKANLFFDQAIIDNYESGRVMSEIFRRYSYLLIISLLFIAIYESYTIYKGERSISNIVFVTTALICGLLFAFYYTPEILHAQSQGVEATLTDRFATIHKQAEISFKLLSFSLIMMIFLKVLRLQKAN